MSCDILLAVDMIIDLCVEQSPGYASAAQAIERCRSAGGRLWLYTGSVGAMLSGLKSSLAASDTSSRAESVVLKARRVLAEFVRDKQWLAALAVEGDVFASEDPEGEQLLCALNRFQDGTIVLLTSDAALLARSKRAVSPACYVQMVTESRSLDFADLRSQQDAIRPRLEENIHRVLHHGQYIMGPEVAELESRLAAFAGAEHCIAVASGTEAMLISLLALGVGPGDEVITTPFTFVATAEVIVLLGAKPVFIDIEPDTCNIDASKIAAAITPKTKAIMPVSLYGQPADMDAINTVAAWAGVPVIEDAAQSFGAEYRGRKSCNLSTIGCTSFFPSKPLGCYGDGGAIFTSDSALALTMREIRVHGQQKRYHHSRIGVGGRMDTLQCGILLAKLERFPAEVMARQVIAARYNELLAGKLKSVAQRSDRSSVYAQYTVFVEDRSKVVESLKAAGIPTAVHYPVPLHLQPAYRLISGTSSLCVSESVAARVVSLPMSADMSLDQVAAVVACLIAALGDASPFRVA